MSTEAFVSSCDCMLQVREQLQGPLATAAKELASEDGVEESEHPSPAGVATAVEAAMHKLFGEQRTVICAAACPAAQHFTRQPHVYILWCQDAELMHAIMPHRPQTGNARC